MTLDEMERAMIVKCMRHYEGNVTRVAEALGLSRAALYRRFEKYGLDPPEKVPFWPENSSQNIVFWPQTLFFLFFQCMAGKIHCLGMLEHCFFGSNNV